MTIVGRPPVLRISHQMGEVLLESIVIKAVEGSSIVELCIERIRLCLVLTEHIELDSVRPPIAVLSTKTRSGNALAIDVGLVSKWTLSHFDRVTRKGLRGESKGEGEAEVKADKGKVEALRKRGTEVFTCRVNKVSRRKDG